MVLPRSKPQALRVYRPTPTTVSFTVSTCTPASSLTSQLLHYFNLIVRLVFGLFVLALLLAKWQTTYPLQLASIRSQFGAQYAKRVEIAMLSEPLLGWAWGIVEWVGGNTEWRYLMPASLAVLWIVTQRGYQEESLLVLRGLGVQTSTLSSSYLSTSITRFIPTTSIQDIFIHEAFKGFEVRFYLAIVVKGEEDVVVVFPNILPKRHILEDVWRGARACLHESKK